MATIYMVRHGRAAASFTDDLDPGLDDFGLSEAQAGCEQLKARLPLQLISSPLRRARETAMPLLAGDGESLIIDDRVAEIPSPGLGLEERGPWLREVMAGKWSQQTPALQDWRNAMRDFLLSLDRDSAIFSHFVAINAMVGAATGQDEVMVFRPDNASITVFNNEDGKLTLVTRGDEATTTVN